MYLSAEGRNEGEAKRKPKREQTTKPKAEDMAARKATKKPAAIDSTPAGNPPKATASTAITQEQIDALGPKNPQTGPKRIAIETILDLRKRGLSTPQIAKLLNCSTTNIGERLRKCVDITETTDNFKKHRGDILAYHQQDALSKLAESCYAISTARDVKDISIAFRNFFECERLERGQSTENIDCLVTSRKLEGIRAELKTLQDERQAIELEAGLDGTYDLPDVEANHNHGQKTGPDLGERATKCPDNG